MKIIDFIRNLFTTKRSVSLQSKLDNLSNIDQNKQYTNCKLFNVIVRRTSSTNLAKALDTARFSQQHINKIIKAASNENVIIATLHYEKAEHIANILIENDPSLRVSITAH